MKKYVLLQFAIAFISVQLHAQDIPKKLMEEQWVKIMANDSSGNFLEADAAFQKYYAAYVKEKNKAEKPRQPTPARMEEEHLRNPEEFLIERYFKWSINIKPFVSSDGRIMPMAKRMQIINAAKKQGNFH